MKRIYIYCEGPTEESFINRVMAPYFIDVGTYLIPIICATKRTATKKYKGGVTNYDRIKHELTRICRQHPHELVTTMFDYYAMPADTPGIGFDDVDLYQRIYRIEEEINRDIGMPNCQFHFMVHEFEGILFSKPEAFGMIADSLVVEKLQAISDAFPTPEHINDSPETAPSKRIQNLVPNYAKVRYGTLLAQDMGMNVILENCRHFREWVEMLRKW